MKKPTVLILCLLGAGAILALGWGVRQRFKAPPAENFALLQELTQMRHLVGEGLEHTPRSFLEKHPCPEILGPDPLAHGPSYFRCNPLAAQCYLRQKGRQSPVDVKRIETSFDREGRYFRVLLGHGPGERWFVHRPSCPEIKIPHGQYLTLTARGPLSWQHSSHQLLVDRFLVSFLDIKLWTEAIYGPMPISLPSDPQRWSRPATGLKLSQMRQFCHAMGKELLQTSVYDGAVIFRDWKRWQGPLAYTPYLAGPRESFEAVDEVSPADCDQIFSLECREKFSYASSPGGSGGSGGSEGAISWAGLGQSVGGVMEAMEDVTDGRFNLRVSSFYFPRSHVAHEVGRRVQWNGVGRGRKSVTWRDQKDRRYSPSLRDQERLAIGFRCMRWER